MTTAGHTFVSTLPGNIPIDYVPASTLLFRLEAFQRVCREFPQVLFGEEESAQSIRGPAEIHIFEKAHMEWDSPCATSHCRCSRCYLRIRFALADC